MAGETVPEEDGAEGEGAEGAAKGRKRGVSNASSLARLEEEEDGRVDARNAASRLAQTTF